VGALAYLLGSIPTEPAESEVQRVRGWLLVLQANLREPFLTPDQVTALVTALRPRVAALGRTFPEAVPGADDALGIVPSRVQAGELRQVADAVARMATWQKAHHGVVHKRLVTAESREGAAMVAVAASVTDLGRSVAGAFRAVVSHMLPELRGALVELIREERQLRRAADVDLRDHLQHRVEVVAERVGDVVRWLRTEALPEAQDLVRTEVEGRKAQDRALASDLAAEAEAREGTDVELATALAPLVSWFPSFGLHTTTKVKTHEQLIDQLGRMDLGLLLSLTAFPNLVELVVRILSQVGGQVPQIVAALESAADEALGAVS
jgi:hypothetical protein